MAETHVELESRTPHFGLRDFLFYLVPGGVTLTAIAAVSGVEMADIKEWGNVGSSIVGLFFAYLLGQVVYPFTYLIRPKLAPKVDWGVRPEEFARLHKEALEENAAYYAAVIFRDRSFARFTLAMITPSLVLGGALGVRLWVSSRWLATFCVLAGSFSAYGFFKRFQYDLRYHREVLLCRDRKFENPKSLTEMD